MGENASSGPKTRAESVLPLRFARSSTKRGQILARNHRGCYEILATARKTDVAVSPVPGATCQRLPWWNFKSALFVQRCRRDFSFLRKCKPFNLSLIEGTNDDFLYSPTLPLIVCLILDIGVSYGRCIISVALLPELISKKKKEEDIKKSRKILDDNEKRRNCLEKENEFIRHKWNEFSSESFVVVF